MAGYHPQIGHGLAILGTAERLVGALWLLNLAEVLGTLRFNRRYVDLLRCGLVAGAGTAFGPQVHMRQEA